MTALTGWPLPRALLEASPTTRVEIEAYAKELLAAPTQLDRDRILSDLQQTIETLRIEKFSPAVKVASTERLSALWDANTNLIAHLQANNVAACKAFVLSGTFDTESDRQARALVMELQTASVAVLNDPKASFMDQPSIADSDLALAIARMNLSEESMRVMANPDAGSNEQTCAMAASFYSSARNLEEPTKTMLMRRFLNR
jgi:hypothetical protein